MTTKTDEVRLLEIDGDITDLEAKTKALKHERGAVEARLLERWAETGTTKTTINGRTIYSRRSLKVNARNGRPQLLEALKEAGLMEYVKEDYNTNSVAGYVRGQARNLAEETGDDSPDAVLATLPEPLAAEVDLFEHFQIISRGG